MKKLFTLILICLTLIAKADYWTQKATFPGMGLIAPFSFSIGNKGYIGTGSHTNEFWEYDPLTNLWSQKANFGGGNRYGAVGFSINNMGYLGTGKNGSVTVND